MSALGHAVQAAELLRALMFELRAQGGIPNISVNLALGLGKWAADDRQYETTKGQQE